MLSYQALEFKDFTGGISDNILIGAQNQYEYADNLIITQTKGLLQRDGSEIYDDVNYQIPAGSQRIGALLEHDDTLFVQSSKNLYYISTTWQTLLGASSNPVFSAGDVNSTISWAKWNDHLIVTNDSWASPMKIYKDGSSVWKVRNAGLPKMTLPTITPDFNDSKTYIYYFLYFYSYTVGTVTYEDYGATVSKLVSSAGDLSGAGHYNQISAIPVIANGVTGNYDTANIKVKIYRTEDLGIVAYYVGEVTNGTTTFTDNVLDTTIITNAIIYVDSGVYDNDPPPLAKYVAVADDICWYANVKEGSEIFANRIRQSNKFDIDSCPESFYVDVEDDITGISSIGNIPIVFCRNKVYRLEGAYDYLGRGVLDKKIIDDTIGCIGNLSIVQTQNGIFFASEDGFCVTDGYRVIKLSDNFIERYKQCIGTTTKDKRLYGTYDSANNRIWWAVQYDDSSTDNDFCFIYDLRFSAFTTAKNGEYFAPTALKVFGDDFLRADRRGYLFRHDPEIYVDPKIDVTALPSAWLDAYIPYNYQSCGIDFGTGAIRKWVSKIAAMFDNLTKLSVRIRSENDSSNYFADLKEIKFNNNVRWGDPDVEWGSDLPRWNYYDIIKEIRRFPANGLRCTYKQVQFTNSLTIIDKSDLRGLCTVDAVTKQATLADYPTEKWDAEAVDYYISFVNDSYVKQYLISSRSDATITFIDIANTCPTGSSKWVLRGYRKNEKISILSYVLYYAPMTDSFQPYEGEDSNA